MADQNTNPYGTFQIPTITSGASGALPQVAPPVEGNPYSDFVIPEQQASPLAGQEATLQSRFAHGAGNVPIGLAQTALHAGSMVAPSLEPASDKLDQYIRDRQAEYAKTFQGGEAPNFDPASAAGGAAALSPLSFAVPGLAGEVATGIIS